MNKRIITLGVVAFVLSFFVCVCMYPSFASARVLFSMKNTDRPVRHTRLEVLVPNWKVFIALGRCEQPGDGKWGIAWDQTRNSSYPGGLGVFAANWNSEEFGGLDMAPSADKATPIQQMIQAQRIINTYNIHAWGCGGVALSHASLKVIPDRQVRWAAKQTVLIARQDRHLRR